MSVRKEFMPQGVYLSVKDIMNDTNGMDYYDICVKNFLDPANLFYLYKQILLACEKYGRKVDNKTAMDLINKNAKTYINDWKKNNDSRGRSETVTIAISHINFKFIQFCYNKIVKDSEITDSNVFRMKAKTRAGEEKLYRDMSVEEYREFDVWEPYEVNVDPNKYRRQNKFPVWQYAGWRRDQVNDGLRYASAERSSLLAPVYGYNMEDIYRPKYINKDNRF